MAMIPKSKLSTSPVSITESDLGLGDKPVYTAFPDGTYTLTVDGVTSFQEDIGLAVIINGRYVGALVEDEEENLIATPVVDVSGLMQTLDVSIQEVDGDGEDEDEDEDEGEDEEGEEGDDTEADVIPAKPIVTR